jgi:hypothetical protein
MWMLSMDYKQSIPKYPHLLPEEYVGTLVGYDLIDVRQKAARAAFAWLCCATLPRPYMERNVAKRIALFILESACDWEGWTCGTSKRLCL